MTANSRNRARVRAATLGRHHRLLAEGYSDWVGYADQDKERSALVHLCTHLDAMGRILGDGQPLHNRGRPRPHLLFGISNWAALTPSRLFFIRYLRRDLEPCLLQYIEDGTGFGSSCILGGPHAVEQRKAASEQTHAGLIIWGPRCRPPRCSQMRGGG